jgi:hypothetical protein
MCTLRGLLDHIFHLYMVFLMQEYGIISFTSPALHYRGSPVLMSSGSAPSLEFLR